MRKLFALLIIAIFINGCTKDDICPEGSDTTPLLIITFNDVANTALRKEVPNLTVEAVGNTITTTILTATTTDSIAIPLRTNVDETRYRFIRQDGGETENADLIDFIYAVEDVYVNRACAFKAEYNNLQATIENEGSNNWILDANILKALVADETEAHITILH